MASFSAARDALDAFDETAAASLCVRREGTLRVGKSENRPSTADVCSGSAPSTTSRLMAQLLSLVGRDENGNVRRRPRTSAPLRTRIASVRSKVKTAKAPLEINALLTKDPLISILARSTEHANDEIIKAAEGGDAPALNVAAQRMRRATLRAIRGLGNYTPLHHAARGGHLKCARILASRGCDVNARL